MSTLLPPVALPAPSSDVVEVLLRRIWVYLGQVHHIAMDIQELAGMRLTKPRLRHVRMDVIYELESTFALMLPETDPRMTGRDLAVLVARVLAREALARPCSN